MVNFFSAFFNHFAMLMQSEIFVFAFVLIVSLSVFGAIISLVTGNAL